MTPLVHSSLGSITLVPRVYLNQRKEIHLTRCEISSKCRKFKTSERILLPQSSLRLFHLYGNRYSSRIQTIAAVGADIKVEEPSSAASGEVTDENTEEPSNTVESTAPTSANTSPASAAKNRRPRPVRKSEMPPVKDEELIPGASFTGKVRSIQPFGCFVDFGAYTDGLVHVSRMSDGYVKDVSSFVSIGQEVKVKIVEANRENGRISLTMRENDETSRVQQKIETPKGENSEKPRSARKSTPKSNQRREDTQKSTNLVKGQILDGTVKKLTRSGAFVSFPDGEEGFLPASEESEGFGGILGSSSLQVGQEVNVRVLRISRGKVTLTMKKEEDVEGLNMQLNKGVTHVASNPFELAFRKNKEIAAFLAEREQTQSSEKPEESVEKVDEPSAESDDHKDDGPTAASTEELLKASDESSPSTSSESVDLLTEVEEISETLTSSSSDSVVDEIAETNVISASDTLEDQNLNMEGGELTENDSSVTEAVDEASLTDKVEEASTETDKIKETDAVDGAVLGDSVSSETPIVSETNAVSGSDTLEDQKLNTEGGGLTESDLSVTEIIDETSLTDEVEETSTPTNDVTEIDATVGAVLDDGASSETPNSETSHSEDVAPDEIANPQDNTAVNNAVEETPIAAEKENVSANLEDGKVEAAGSINAQAGPSGRESAVKATVSPALVKQLREETGAGMMDCKKALAETGGDIVKAKEFLRKKGLASADKKSSRATAEGRIGSYIHDNRIGVLIEVNCETDFVSRGEIFKELVDDLAMQVAACPQVNYVATVDVPEDIVNKEKEIEMQKEDLLKKPENIRSKIVDGRINKRLEELSLLDQPYIKNDKLVVGDLIKQTIATIGENIKVKRFVRYNLGEGLEKKNQDFAAEVAAQTAAQPTSSVSTNKPAETNEATEKTSTVVVSAVLVKQLREETGAGMMDCKNALAETGGDLVKAQEYLRKKGLSSAEKKSSRLAAEGRIASYIHDSRIGTLIEVNCETDFVARNEKFKELVDDLAMQVVACPQVEFVSIEEISEDVVKKEKDIEMQREDLKSKPEQIKEKIVEGRITKRLGELALLEQPFIKDDSIKVKDLIKQTVAALGENIKVRRFIRFTLGEIKN